MASIKDDRGFNQGFRPSEAMKVRTQRRCDYIIGKLNPRAGQEILEIGCGTGEKSYIFASCTKAEVLGIDLCKPFIEQAKKDYSLKNLRYAAVDFNNPKGLAGKSFDFIVGDGILHHLYPDMDSALARISKLLKKGGRIVFLEPNLLNPYCFLIFNFRTFRKLANLEPAEMAFTKGFITERLKRAGFREIKVEYKDFLLPNTPKGLIRPVIAVGKVAEKVPLFKNVSQSIFIYARK